MNALFTKWLKLCYDRGTFNWVEKIFRKEYRFLEATYDEESISN